MDAQGLRMNLVAHSLTAEVAPLCEGARSIIDVGCGIRPALPNDPRVIHVEPYDAYVDVLRGNGLFTIQGTAQDIIPRIRCADVILLLDVIEHLEKAEGLKLLDCLWKSTKKVVVFTPIGFMQQTEDAWHLGGDVWQTHRSGWLPEEFTGWHTRTRGKMFYAIQKF